MRRYCGVHQVLLVGVGLFAVTMVADAVPGGGKVAREGVEQLGSRLARDSGEAAATVTARQLNRLAARHGPELRVLYRNLGPEAVEVAARYGDDGVRLMSRYGNEGMAVLVRKGDEVLPLVRRYGDEVMEAAIRHPGIGERLVSRYGREGLRLSQRLSTDEAIALLARPANAAAVPARAPLSARLAGFATRYPRTVLGGAAIGLLAVQPDWFQSVLSTLTQSIGTALRAGLEGLVGEEAAAWAVWVIIGLVLGTVWLIYGAPRAIIALGRAGREASRRT